MPMPGRRHAGIQHGAPPGSARVRRDLDAGRSRRRVINCC